MSWGLRSGRVRHWVSYLGLRGLAVSGVALASMAVPAQAAPVKVESENIVLYGDVRPDTAEDFVRQMERYRRLVFALSNRKNPKPDAQKLTIHGFNSSRGVQIFAGNRGIAGVYTQGQDGPVFATLLGKRKSDANWANQVALHEYSHHVLHAVIGDSFPRWYDEGFANYLSTLSITDEMIHVGEPSIEHLRYIGRKSDWLDPKIVLSAIDRYPTFRGRSRGMGTTYFYAQSWLYVHYLQNNAELGRKLPDYLAAIDRGVSPIAAFERSFGLSVEDFHERAVAPFLANRFNIFRFEPQGDFMDVDVTVTPISEGELAYAELPGQQAFLSDENASGFAKRIKAAEAARGADARTVSARAALAIALEDYDRAKTAANAALAQAPGNVVLQRTLADARYHLLQESGTNARVGDSAVRVLPVGAEFDAMVEGFAAVLQSDPNDRTAVTHLVDAFAFSDAPDHAVLDTAIPVMEDKYMERGDAGGALSLAAVHHKRGKTERACDYLDYARGAVPRLKKSERGRLPAELAFVESRLGQACPPK